MSARTPLTYLAVSGSCVLLHSANLIVADSLGIPLGMAVLASFTTVACVGYILHALFTFRQPLTASGLVRYAFGMSANVPLAYLTIWMWHAAFGISMLIAAPASSACMLGLNFVIGRWAVSSPQRARSGSNANQC